MKTKGVGRCLATVAMVAAVSVAPAMGWAEDNESTSTFSPFIEQFDADGDGLVSADEFPEDETLFSRLDVDGSGTIDATEASQGPPPHDRPDAAAMLSEFDSDGDGLLSPDEFPGPADHFDHLDTDGDGLLSADELDAGGPAPGPAGEDRFADDDVNADGRVSQTEFSGPEDLFARLDADGDGYISQQEAHAPVPHGGPDSFTE